MDEEKHGVWPEFQRVCRLTLDKVIPRLLGPLQSDGRAIKPCLIHGDLWDENTATDMNNGEPFVFDAGAMHAHNEYELGNWRAPRHRLSNKSYVESYKLDFPVSEPSKFFVEGSMSGAILILLRSRGRMGCTQFAVFATL